MLKYLTFRDRQEILAVGELALFVAVWFTVIWNAVDFYRHRAGLVPGDKVAASTQNELLPHVFE